MAYGKNTTKKSDQRETTLPAFIAWHIAERGEKNFWTRIGAVWGHEDGGGLTLQLDLYPATGGRIVRPPPLPKRSDAQFHPVRRANFRNNSSGLQDRSMGSLCSGLSGTILAHPSQRGSDDSGNDPRERPVPVGRTDQA